MALGSIERIGGSGAPLCEFDGCDMGCAPGKRDWRAEAGFRIKLDFAGEGITGISPEAELGVMERDEAIELAVAGFSVLVMAATPRTAGFAGKAPEVALVGRLDDAEDEGRDTPLTAWLTVDCLAAPGAEPAAPLAASIIGMTVLLEAGFIPLV